MFVKFEEYKWWNQKNEYAWNEHEMQLFIENKASAQEPTAEQETEQNETERGIVIVKI